MKPSSAVSIDSRRTSKVALTPPTNPELPHTGQPADVLFTRPNLPPAITLW